MANQYTNAAPKVTVSCLCGNEFKTTEKRIKEGHGKFCSLSCKYKYCKMPKRGKGSMNITKENPSWFKKGQIPWNEGKKYKMNPDKIKKGYHNSPDTQFKNGIPPWNKGKKIPEMSGINHHNWVGDKVSYMGIHTWIYRNFDQQNKCNKCGTLDAKRFEWHNLSGEYKRDRTDWERLCSKCHHHHHKNWIKANEKTRHGKAI